MHLVGRETPHEIISNPTFLYLRLLHHTWLSAHCLLPHGVYSENQKHHPKQSHPRLGSLVPIAIEGCADVFDVLMC